MPGQAVPTNVLKTLLAAILLFSCLIAAAQPAQPHSSDQILTDILAKLEKLQQQKTWRSPELWIPLMGTLVAAAGGWSIAFVTLRRTLSEQRTTRELQQRAQLQDQVSNSLKWFEGGSQKRSLGIADIETHISDQKFRDFYQVWAAVLVNQAIYLIVESEQTDSLQETNNLERMLNMLPRLPATYEPIREAYSKRIQGHVKKGVPLSRRVEGLINNLPKEPELAGRSR